MENKLSVGYLEQFEAKFKEKMAMEIEISAKFLAEMEVRRREEIASASESEPETDELCDNAMELMLRLLPPESFGEDPEAAELYLILEIIKHRHLNQKPLKSMSEKLLQ